MFDSFNQFYDSLSQVGVLFFWGIVFIFFFILFLCIALIYKNMELKNRLVKMQNDNSNKKVEPEVEKIKIETKIEEEKTEEKTGPYSKNVLREIKTRDQTSPIGIIKKDQINAAKINIENKSVNNDQLKDNGENISFVKEISEKMEKELEPQTIELTDYERQQEEEAVISYQELLSKKDKLYNITEEENTSDFIDELKSFRLDLQK